MPFLLPIVSEKGKFPHPSSFGFLGIISMYPQLNMGVLKASFSIRMYRSDQYDNCVLSSSSYL